MSLEIKIEENTQAVRELTAVLTKFLNVPGAIVTPRADEQAAEKTLQEIGTEMSEKFAELKGKKNKKVVEAKAEQPPFEVEAESEVKKVEAPAEVKKVEAPAKDNKQEVNEDYEAVRTECRQLLANVIDKAGRDEAVRILRNFDAKSLKEIKDVDLTFLRNELNDALEQVGDDLTE